MDPEERKARDAERIAYLENEIENQIKDNPLKFLDFVCARASLAAKDIFGEDSPAMRFMDSVRSTGKPHPATFSAAFTFKGTSLIDPTKAERVGRNIAYELLRVHDNDAGYYVENNMYGLWEILEDAGMSHNDIGRYFERYAL
jgi:hypothetical protein